jgi:MFS family permease
MGAVSLVFFFLNLSTFQSLGVVLFAMVAELHWSMTAVGTTFTFLGLACGLSSPLPGGLMGRIGARATIFIGSILLVIGFVLCAYSHSLFSFFVAMTLVGIGYSFAGNVPGVYLITGWFDRSYARMIGYYLMIGALGASVAPPIVNEIVSLVGWRGHWIAMAVTAGVIGVICLIVIRESKSHPDTDEAIAATSIAVADPAHVAQHDWTPRQAVFTPQFLLVAAAMATTMACVTTISAVDVFHFVKLGDTPKEAAFVFSVLASTATVIKAISGWLCQKIRPVFIVSAGLVLQAAGFAVIAIAANPLLQFASAAAFGAGWGLTYVAGTVVLVDYFGGQTGSKILSIVWFLTSIAAGGPPLAGWIADNYGTFAPIFYVFAVLSFVLALPIWFMQRPASPIIAAQAQHAPDGAISKVEAA